MNSDVVSYERRDNIAIIALNRPTVANAINAEVAQTLGRIAREVEEDSSIRVAILTGTGTKAFCAGADLKSIAAGERASLYTDEGGFAGFVDLPRAKLWIAAVNAPALAGGLELVLSCDLIVASSEAHFALPEVRRGLIAAAGGLFRLPRRIPIGEALIMIASGDTVSAERALKIGLVDRLAPRGMAIDVACEMAALVARNAPIAVRESLQVARVAAECDTATLRELSQAAALRNAATEDFKEGPRAFLEKRAPVWKGR